MREFMEECVSYDTECTIIIDIESNCVCIETTETILISLDDMIEDDIHPMIHDPELPRYS